MPLSFTVETTTTEFKDKHGGWPIAAMCATASPLTIIAGHFARGIQRIDPKLSITAISRNEKTIFFVLYGASSLEYEQFTKRTGEPLMTFPNGFKVFNFFKVYEYMLPKLDAMISPPAPPAYTEKPQQEQPQQEQPQQQANDALASAWKEIEEARKQIEESKQQIEEEKMKMKLRAKMMLFDEEMAKFKQQFFTQDELVSIRKTFDERF
jgi:hypothetical protein